MDTPKHTAMCNVRLCNLLTSGFPVVSFTPSIIVIIYFNTFNLYLLIFILHLIKKKLYYSS